MLGHDFVIVAHSAIWQKRLACLSFATTAVCCSHAFAQDQSHVYIPPISEVLRPPLSDSPLELDALKASPAVALYIRTIEQKLEKVRTAWPRTELGERLYGDIQMMFVISEEGSLLDVYPLTSGQGVDQKLVEYSLRVARAAQPFPVPPPEVIQGKKSVKFASRFWLMRAGEIDFPR